MKSLSYLIIPLLVTGVLPRLHANTPHPRAVGISTAGIAAPSDEPSPRLVADSVPGMHGAHPEDVIIIPFGNTTKRTLNGSVGTFRGDSVSQMPLSSLFNVMLGKVPGLYVEPRTTGPGNEHFSLLIRGRASYNDEQAPLLLVDGIERDLADMDINEIASISVLKDAASLAWYGMRGANGVILATTRRGIESDTRVTVDATGGVQLPRDYTKSLDSYTYATLYNEALRNDGLPPRYSDQMLADYRNNTAPFIAPSNDLPKRFINQAAPVQRYVASVSGGNATAKYFTLLSYYNQGGLLAESKTPDYRSNPNFTRYNFRSNVDVSISTDLDVFLNINGRVENRREPGTNTGFFGVHNVLDAIYSTPPNAYPLINEDGSFGGSSLFQNNPLAMLQHNGYNYQFQRMLMTSIGATYRLNRVLEGLSANAMYSYDFVGDYIKGQNQNFEVYQYEAATASYTRFGNATPLVFRDATFSNPMRTNELWAGFDYSRSFNNQVFDASLRYNNAALFNLTQSKLDFRRESISSRFSYNYGSRYMADLVLTYASNKWFSPTRRNGLFPALALGWVVIDNQPSGKPSPLNYAKLRASYGITGNEGLMGARMYHWQQLYGAGFPGYVFGASFSPTGSGVGELALANPDLTFEKSTKFNVGADVELFGKQLDVSVEYFREKRTDMISPVFMPGIIGQSLVPGNNGEARYAGIEAAIDYKKQFHNFFVNLYGNVTFVKSELSRFDEQPGLPAYQYQTGHPLGNLGLLYQSVGVFESQAEIDAAPVQRLAGRVRPGDIRYADLNGDQIIDQYDRQIMDHTALPRGYYGLGALLRFRNVDLTAFFSGVWGRTVDLNGIVNAGTDNNGYLNEFSVDRWTPESASGALWPRLAVADRGNNTVPSTFWLRSGDYLQLRNVEIGYTIGNRVASRWSMDSFRIYVAGYNLMTFSKLNALNINPVIPTSGRLANYPYLATLSLGVTVKF